ncbi:DUF2933 domain-containing protein [Aurantivibrio plasticivorans]
MSDQKQSFWMSPKGFAAMGLIASVSYFVLMEHRQHFFQWLPFLIILLCPLMHIFMHGGHGHNHGGHDDHNGSSENESEAYKRGLKDGQKNSNQHHSH